ncbi:hypothetical protein GCM10017771_90900 [Streptomyces capitiformicae]|uniref:Uncharacterized protein n=1 Tax=Streptomyces capitiformicae TaxID=2014920 RepID=A0A919DQ93_9ACTN|nr:hypothetical protein GCM10017771_90900 [Streptomyces capitiformicae]
MDTTHSPIGTTFSNLFRSTGLTMPTLRQDRIRDEAFEVDDPLRLMRLFGISSHTAMRYITFRPTPNAQRSSHGEASGSGADAARWAKVMQRVLHVMRVGGAPWSAPPAAVGSPR